MLGLARIMFTPKHFKTNRKIWVWVSNTLSIWAKPMGGIRA